MYYVKFNVFGLIGHICPLKMISLSLSILSCDNFNATYLTYYDVIQRVQAQAITVVHYACFSLNKFWSLSITLWYSALALITFNCFLSHNVHSKFGHSLVKFLSIEICYSLSHVIHEKCYIFSLIGHIWPSLMTIESIFLSFYLSLYLSLHKALAHYAR